MRKMPDSNNIEIDDVAQLIQLAVEGYLQANDPASKVEVFLHANYPALSGTKKHHFLEDLRNSFAYLEQYLDDN